MELEKIASTKWSAQLFLEVLDRIFQPWSLPPWNSMVFHPITKKWPQYTGILEVWCLTPKQREPRKTKWLSFCYEKPSFWVTASSPNICLCHAVNTMAFQWWRQEKCPCLRVTRHLVRTQDLKLNILQERHAETNKRMSGFYFVLFCYI